MDKVIDPRYANFAYDNHKFSSHITHRNFF